MKYIKKIAAYFIMMPFYLTAGAIIALLFAVDVLDQVFTWAVKELEK